jgi:homoserine kinase
VSAVRHQAVSVPATTANLGPGFDAFGMALDRNLSVRSRPLEGAEVRVEVRGEGAGELPGDESNLVWRSLEAFCERHGVPVPDVGLVANSDVPLERGMGSSSAAIVAGLALGRALTGVAVGDRELVVLADEIEGHPDNVAPALLGGLVACARTQDGRLVVRRINPAPRLRPLLLVPDDRQLTTDARASLPASLPREDVVAQAARAGHVLVGLTGAWPVAPQAAIDLLHEPTRLEAMSSSGRVVEALRGAGMHAWLSGAGPSVAMMAPGNVDEGAAVAREVGEREGFVLVATRTQLAGTIVCPDGACAFAGGTGCVQCPRRSV